MIPPSLYEHVSLWLSDAVGEHGTSLVEHRTYKVHIFYGRSAEKTKLRLVGLASAAVVICFIMTNERKNELTNERSVGVHYVAAVRRLVRYIPWYQTSGKAEG